MQTASRFLLRLHLAMAFALHLHLDLAILQAVPGCAKIVDLFRRRMDSASRAHLCFLLCRARAEIGSLAVGLCPALAMELDFRPVAAAGFFAARFWPAPGSTCLENFCSGWFLIGFAIAPAGFDLCRSCPAIEIVAGLGFAHRRFAAD